jgi:FAD:protein FMN transferase
MIKFIKRKLTNIKRNNLTTISVLVLLLFFSGCGNASKGNSQESSSKEYITRSDFLLNTQITINLYDKQDKDVLDGCFQLISKYENIYSRTLESSELYSLNNGTVSHVGQTYQISDELSDLLTHGLYYSKLSGGAFDISIEPLTSLWDFTASNPTLPSDNDIWKAIPLVDYKNIRLNKNEVTFLKDGIGIDLGAIAKGYIADRLKDYLLAAGVKSALINLGGNVLCVGEKPDGSPFHVGIQKPFADRNEIVGVMDIDNLSVVSSGIYERCFTIDGVLYHHILNPKSGYPYDNNLVSVTIISKLSVDGDGLSTTCFALGLDKGLELIESIPDTYAIFITSEYEIHYSKGFLDTFHFTPQK